MGSRWRDIAAPIIAKVITDHPPGKERRKALIEAYPFGDRKYHPYKIWLDEMAKQEGRKPRNTNNKQKTHGDQHLLPSS